MFGKAMNTPLDCYRSFLMRIFSLHKKITFFINNFFGKYANPQEKRADLITFTDEIFNGKLHILYAVFLAVITFN